MKKVWLVVALVVGSLTPGCKNEDRPGRGDAGPLLDAGSVDSGLAVDAGSTAMANIADVVQCGPAPVAGPGLTTEFQRHVLDSAVFPDALCNDGTPATLYFRPYSGAANRNKWIVNLHGGGSCNGAGPCLARWCGCGNTTQCPFTTTPTNYDRSDMTNVGQPMKAADGVFLRGDAQRPNPFGDYNQVEFVYCSSDTWRGNRRAVSFDSVNPKTGAAVTYTIHFLGARILDAHLATLRQDGVPALTHTLAGPVQMPDLDEATEIIVTGDSAGGAGVVTNLDHITDTLRAHNVNCTGASCPLKVWGLLDAVVGPERERLDFGTFTVPQVRSYADFTQLLAMGPTAIAARIDTSCRDYHAVTETDLAGACLDESHVLRHHLSTPFFARVALLDSGVSENYIESGFRNANMTAMTPMSFAVTLHDELGSFANLSATAEERTAITRQPGVFAPGCAKHDTIHSAVETWGTTITPPGGTPQRLMNIFENWRNGTGITNLLTESPTRTDTVCPSS